MKLNPTKCTFGVTFEKLLGFVVSKKGIEIDPDKVRAIQNLPPPCTQKEVKSFMGRLDYIARFISQMMTKCDPIFKMLRKHNSDKWDEECQMAFEKVKEYLTNAPVLVPPVPDNTCFTTPHDLLRHWIPLSISLRSLHCLKESQGGKFHY